MKTRRSVPRWLLAGLIQIVLAAPLKAAPNTASPAALQTVDAYLQALISGQLNGLGDRLGPAMLERYQPLLDNPDNAADVLQAYAGAAAAIIASRASDNGNAEVDARLTLANGELVNVRFSLQAAGDGAYVIVAEQ